MKARLKGAQTGRNLLKKKSDALSMRFRQILRKIIEVSWLSSAIPIQCDKTSEPSPKILTFSPDKDEDGRSHEGGSFLFGWGQVYSWRFQVSVKEVH